MHFLLVKAQETSYLFFTDTAIATGCYTGDNSAQARNSQANYIHAQKHLLRSCWHNFNMLARPYLLLNLQLSRTPGNRVC